MLCLLPKAIQTQKPLTVHLEMIRPSKLLLHLTWKYMIQCVTYDLPIGLEPSKLILEQKLDMPVYVNHALFSCTSPKF